MRHRRLLVAIGSIAALLALLLASGVVGSVPQVEPRHGTDATSSLAMTAIAPEVADETSEARVGVSPSFAVELRCRVCRGMSAPFPGAAVRVDVAGRQGSTQTVRVTADGQGIARITLADPAATTATFTSDRADVWGKPAVLVLQPGSAPTALLRLYPLDAQVQGVVTDLADRPLPGARVRWFPELPAVPCDGQGRFALRVSSAMEDLRCLFLAPGHCSARESLVLTPGDRIDLHVRLQPGPLLSGRVTDADGRPVPGAVVETILQRISGEQITTDEEGRYTIDCVMPGRTTEQVSVRCPGFVPASAQVAIKQGVAQQDFTLQAAASVRGRVLRPDGSPACGVVVSNQVARVFGYAHEETRTEAGGSFVLDELTPGRCELKVHCDGFPPARTAVEVAAGASIDTTIHLVAGLTARGTVVGEDSLPIAGAWVMEQSAHTSTDAQGRFELEGLPATACQVDVMQGDHVALRAEPLSLAAENRFVLVRAGQLGGRAVDARTGKGLEDFTVTIAGGDSQQGSIGVDWARGGRRFQQGGGLWQARGLMLVPGSTWRVRLTAPGYAPASLSITAAVGAADFEVGMTPGVAVTGRLQPANVAVQVAGAALRLLDHPPGERVFESYEPRTVSASDGSFTFAPVAAGQVWIEIRVAGIPPQTVGPFAIGNSDFDLGALFVGSGPSLSGTLRDDAGRTLPSFVLHVCSVHADPRSCVQLQTRTRADGTFTFAGLQPGTWRLFTSIPVADGVVVIDQRLQLDGAERVVEVQPAGRGVLRGEVRGTWPADSPPYILLDRTDENGAALGFAASASLQQGRFCLRGLPPGRYSVTAMENSEGHPRVASKAVVVDDDATTEVVLDLGTADGR